MQTGSEVKQIYTVFLFKLILVKSQYGKFVHIGLCDRIEKYLLEKNLLSYVFCFILELFVCDQKDDSSEFMLIRILVILEIETSWEGEASHVCVCGRT